MPLTPRETALVSLRELCPPPPPKAVRSMIACVVVIAIGVGHLLQSAFDTCCGGTPPGDRARLSVEQLAYEYFPQWSLDHPDRTCPAALRELVPPWKDTIDPWGTPLVFACSSTPLRFAVRSAGPDRLFGTSDDIHSDR